MSNKIIVLFDQITSDEFFHRLEWEFLVSAWSKAIAWHKISPHKVRLELAGLDGLNDVIITRRAQADRIFICAKSSDGKVLQSGLWEYDHENQLGVCFRRVYNSELADILSDRLADFCYSTFLKEENSND